MKEVDEEKPGSVLAKRVSRPNSLRDRLFQSWKARRILKCLH
jgi:hypothetical protein